MPGKVTVYKCPDGTDFPVEWEDPEDEKRGWFWDQMHAPLPVTPLSTTFWQDMGIGFGRAMEATGNPTRPGWVQFNGFNFLSARPPDGDPALLAAIGQADTAKRGHRLLELWRDQYQPECQALTRGIRALADDVARSSWEDLFAQVHAARRRLGELHVLAMGLTTPTASAFINLCKEEFGAGGELIATDLMGGFRNRSLDSAVGLWGLAEAAKSFPGVERLLRENSASEFIRQLPTAKGGSEFREQLDAYLDEFGHRNESFSELSFPTWREDARFPLLMVRRYIDTPPDGSPAALHRRVEERRETRLREVMLQLGEGAERKERFESLMRNAQQRTVLIEDHNFYIDQQGPAATRAVCLAFGQALVSRGAIDARGDVFYLTEGDVVASNGQPGADFRAVVSQRRAERDRWMRVLPPPSIGQGAVMMPEMMQRFFGPVANEPMGEGAFRGVAGSAGSVRATARLILTLDDIDKLAPGEILVTYATAPPWTPAFAIAGGIVTDIGGTLSHCAVVAREYGIPAVVGTRVATATIQDGQLITVDGTNGIVRLER